MGRIEDFLKKREKEGLLRVLRPIDSRTEGKICREGREFIDLSSNDYLGFSTHPKIKDAAREATEKYGTSSSASRLLSGDLDIHHQLEERVADFKGKEAALVFNSGYQANVGIISALYSRGDAIISDRLSHASILDGILLSGARFFRFNHNDSEHLESVLKNNRDNFKNVLIVTETIFSMDGDRAPLGKLVELKEKYNCELMVDEAHATGIFGENGSGLVEEEGLSENIDLVMGTFSKGLGGFGAYLASSKSVKDYLINTCRSFIYSTALPPSVIAANLASLELVKEEPFRRKALLENATAFREKLRIAGFDTRSSSQIVPLVLKSTQKVAALSEELQRKGFWALPIRPPTVGTNEARVRFSLTYHHKKELLEKLANAICESGYVPAHR